MYIWSLQSLGRIGALATFVFIACGALRLARYNVQFDNIESKYFQGLPIPSGAGILITFVIFCEEFLGRQMTENYLVVALTVTAGLLMVSSIPYRSLKTLNFRGGRNAFLMLVAFVLFIFIISLNPDLMFFVLLMGYVASGLLEEMITLRESRKFVTRIREHRNAKKAQRLELVSHPPVSKIDKSHHS